MTQIRLPEPQPRPCKGCGVEYTPKRKRQFTSVYCCLACQRSHCLICDQKHNVELSRATAEQRGDTLRGRGNKKTYTKRAGRHEHRIVAEEILGRPLRDGETVHHIDGNKKNNAKTNIQILSGQGEHARLHAYERRYGRE